MKGEHGVDPIGGDLWMIQDERGRWMGGVWAAAAQGPANSTRAFLGPGPKGAVATERYEALREGMQICEVILFIQRALDSGKLDEKLTERANAVLDERSTRAIDAWVVVDKSGRKEFSPAKIAEGALDRDKELYAVAAAAAQAMR